MKRTIDGLVARPTNAQKTQKRRTVGIQDGVKPTKKKTVARNEDFLQPVQGFESDPSDLTSRDSDNWSEMLDEMKATKTQEEAPLMVTDEDWFSEEDLREDEKRRKKAKRRQKSDEKKPKKRHVVRWVLVSIFSVLVILLGVAYFWGDSLISRLTGGKSGLFDAIGALVSDTMPFEEDEKGRTNVLVFGTEGYDMSGSSGGGVHEGAQLTDSIMVISFDQDTKDVALLSLPRDLKVSMACMAGKINEVFYCNNNQGTDEAAGAQALMTQVGEVLGIKFHYYAHVNWGSLVAIIDTLGGVTVTLDEDISDYMTNTYIQAGVPVTVNGETALGIARARYGTQGGDFTRGNSQQKIVMAIVEKLMANGVDMNQALNILNILGDNLRTNFSTDNIKAGLAMVNGFEMDQMRQVTLLDYSYETDVRYLTTGNINGISYVLPVAGADNYSDIQKYIAKMFSSDPALREDPMILVLNATDTDGVASEERKKLAEAGFDNVGTGNAETGVCDREYCVYVINGEKAGTQYKLEGMYWTDFKTGAELPAGIEAGNADFVILIGK